VANAQLSVESSQRHTVIPVGGKSFQRRTEDVVQRLGELPAIERGEVDAPGALQTPELAQQWPEGVAPVQLLPDFQVVQQAGQVVRRGRCGLVAQGPQGRVRPQLLPPW